MRGARECHVTSLRASAKPHASVPHRRWGHGRGHGCRRSTGEPVRTAMTTRGWDAGAGKTIPILPCWTIRPVLDFSTVLGFKAASRDQHHRPVPRGVFSRALHHASPLADSKEDPAGAAKVIDRVLRSEDERPTPARLLRLLVLRADVAGRLGGEETAGSAPARITADHLGARERESVPDGLERLKEPGVRDRCESAARSRSWRLRPVRSPWIRAPAGEPGGGAALDRTGALGSPPGSARTAGYHPAARPRAAQTGAPGPARRPAATTPPDAPAGCSSGHHAPQDPVIHDRGPLPRQAPTFARGRGRRGEGRAPFTRRSPRSGVPGARGEARLPWRPVC